MIILKHGSSFITKSCPKCGCEFGFDFHDISEEWEQQGDTDDSWVGTAYVCCPECSHKITWSIRKSDNGGVPIEYSKCGQPLYRLWRRGPNL